MVRASRGGLFYAPSWLQWSHVFSDMVRDLDDIMSQFIGNASMEPCLFRHGKRARILWSPVRGRRFNGAMSFQTW